MFKINTAIKLIKFIAGYILIGLGIFAINNLGVAKMILGENVANTYFYPIYFFVIQWATVIFLIALVGLIIFSIISYIRNKGKPDEPSAELKAINKLREEDIAKVNSLGGKRVKTGMELLRKLYTLPIINVKKAEEWTGLSRPSANGLVKEFLRLGILEQRDKKITYGRNFEYKEYLRLFIPE